MSPISSRNADAQMRTNMINRRALFSTWALVPALQPQTAIAQQTRRGGNLAFSFAVYGDSRSMMYLPYKSDQRDEAIKLMVDMFELVLPEKVAEEVVRRDVKLTYDASTDELIQIVMPFESKSEVSTLRLDKGWVTEASVEDVKLLPGVHRTMFRLQGGEWVAREAVKDVQRGDKVEKAYRRGDLFDKRRKLMDEWAKFCLNPAAPIGKKVISIREARR
jgi:hypothetical protein